MAVTTLGLQDDMEEGEEEDDDEEEEDEHGCCTDAVEPDGITDSQLERGIILAKWSPKWLTNFGIKHHLVKDRSFQPENALLRI